MSNSGEEPTQDLDREIVDALKRQAEGRKTSPEEEALIERLQQLPQHKAAALENGRRVHYVGDYQILDVLGRGGMGIVYRARQLSLQRDVALKMLLSAPLGDQELRDRFRLEAEAVARLDHPHIVPVYEIGEHEDHHYFSMRLVPGKNLAEVRAEWICAGQFSPAERKRRERRAAELVEKLAQAMQHAHQHGVLHRDLKPSNVLLDEAGEPHVTDFGLAKDLASDQSLTMTGAVLGTLGYMAPEQAVASKTVTTAVDVYGLGAILYELLTGRPPFRGDSSAHTLQLVLESDPRAPRSIEPALDRDLETICLTCMRKDPNERYASAAQVGDELARFLRGEPILARPVSARERLWKWARRRPAAAALAVVSVLALVVLIAGLAVSNRLLTSAHSATKEALGREQDASYTKTVALAYREVIDGDVRHAQQLLERCDESKRDWEWHFLIRKCNQAFRKFKADYLSPADINYSPDGKLLATLTCDYEKDRCALEVWNADTGAKVVTIIDAVATSRVNDYWRWNPALIFNLDGSELTFTAYVEQGDSKDNPKSITGVVRRYDTRTWKLIDTKPQEFPNRYVTGVMYPLDGRCLAISKPVEQLAARDVPVEMHLHNLNSGEIVYKLTASQRYGNPQLCPDQKHFAWNMGVDVHDFATGELAWQAHFGRASDTVTWSPDGKLLAAPDLNGRVTLCEFAEQGDKAPIRLQIRAHARYAHDVAFLDEGRQFVSVGNDGLVKLWNTADGKEVDSLRFGGQVNYVAVRSDRREVAFANIDGEIGIWNLASQTQVRGPTQVHMACNDMEVSRDGRWLAMLMDQEYVEIWDLEKREKTRRVGILERLPNADVLEPISFALTSDGKLFACGLGDWDKPDRAVGTIGVWDAQSGELLKKIDGLKTAAFCLDWNDDGSVLVAQADDNTVAAWSWPAGEKLWEHTQHERASIPRRPQTPQMLIASANKEGDSRLELIDSRTGQTLQSFPTSLKFVHRPRFSDDGQLLAVASVLQAGHSATTITLIDVETGKERGRLVGGSDGADQIQFSPSGKRLFASYFDGNLLVWDLTTFSELLSLRGEGLNLDQFAVNREGLLVGGEFHGGRLHLLDGSTFRK